MRYLLWAVLAGVAWGQGLNGTKRSGWRELAPEKKGFVQRHPTRTKVMFVVGGLGLGILAHVLTTHNCASTYDGKPYSGTPPCPK